MLVASQGSKTEIPADLDERELIPERKRPIIDIELAARIRMTD
jgi:hypothetical protein